VGASLLAKAVYQSTSSFYDTPLSRAGSLPQLFCGGRGILGNKKAPISGALLFSVSTYMFG
ncbi:MAG: hypothetical protein ABS999_08535, partial [Pseudomonas atacamensis]